MIRIGIPAHDERDWLPRTLASLARQDSLDFEVWVHVNQPPGTLACADHAAVTRANLATLDDLAAARYPFPLRVLDGVRDDRPEEQAGVGWARRLLFEAMLADWDGVVISLDADTEVDAHYVSAVRRAFERQPKAAGLAAPYYHRVPEEPEHALHLLHYEIFMRYYELNLRRVGSPYGYTPLGSAMAFRSGAYRAVGGMPPRQAGEDFYFLERLRKYGPLMVDLDARVYPSSRRSHRVPFGTGPLMADADLQRQMARFPFYPLEAFDLLGDTFKALAGYHREPGPLPLDDFIQFRWKGYGAFERIRRNFKQPRQFVNACHQKLDALATYQSLRRYLDRHPRVDIGPVNVARLLDVLGLPEASPVFRVDALADLCRIRDLLVEAGSRCPAPPGLT